jgi:hypothetical protein
MTPTRRDARNSPSGSSLGNKYPRHPYSSPKAKTAPIVTPLIKLGCRGQEFSETWHNSRCPKRPSERIRQDRAGRGWAGRPGPLSYRCCDLRRRPRRPVRPDRDGGVARRCGDDRSAPSASNRFLGRSWRPPGIARPCTAKPSLDSCVGCGVLEVKCVAVVCHVPTTAVRPGRGSCADGRGDSPARRTLLLL